MTAIIGLSTVVSVDDAGTGANSGASTPLVLVTMVKPPNPVVDFVDSTNLSSLNRTREYITGLINPGEAEIEQEYTKSEFARLFLLRGNKHVFTVQLPSADGGITAGSLITFNGTIMNTELDVSADKMIMMKSKLRCTGGETVT